MTGGRYRMVTFTLADDGGEEHVSSVVVSEEEVHQQIDTEAELHASAGWRVTRGEQMIVCQRGEKTRIISARLYSPMNDKRGD